MRDLRGFLEGVVADSRVRPERPVYTEVDDRGRDGRSLTSAALLRSAAAVAGRLRGVERLEPGTAVILIYPPGADFVVAFLGCMLAGLVPVPVAPVDPMNARKELPRLERIVRDCDARAMLTNAVYKRARVFGRVRGLVGERELPRWPDIPWVVTTERGPVLRRSKPLHESSFHRPSADDIAFLQYTSGSTSDPKGVSITHGNLSHQLALNASELGFGPDTVMAGWVPHFHDFGLISAICSALAGYGHLYMMSPLAFVRRPLAWVELMSRVRANATASPNFGYELVTRKSTPAERRQLDLSSLNVAMIAAEPIRAETLDAFAEAFSVAGFRREALVPAYGLAEHTVGVTMGGVERVVVDAAALETERRVVPRSDGRVLVGCGRVAEGVTVEIVNPESGVPVPAGGVGEIWVDSPSKAKGYFGRPDATALTFEAVVPGRSETFLRTGDLGFLHEGELYVTGRLKDVIILRGRNVHPNDLEESVRGVHPSVRPGGVAFFGTDRMSSGALAGEERVAAMVEVAESDATLSGPAVAEAVRAAVQAEHAIHVAWLVVVPKGTTPRTTSGKVQRQRAKALFFDERLSRDPNVYLKSFEVGGGPSSAAAVAPVDPPKPSRPSPAADDPRIASMGPEFRRCLRAVGRQFANMASRRDARLFHPVATTLSGRFTPIGDVTSPDLLRSSHPVIVRFANGVQADDAHWDNRGASLRFLEREDDLSSSLADFLLTTGETFTSGTASHFARWMRSTRAQREQMVAESPRLGVAAWESFRAIDDYRDVHYHGTCTRLFGEDRLARWRLRAEGCEEDGGFLEPDGALPPDRTARAREDDRPEDFLHRCLRQAVAEEPIRWVLEVQTMDLPEDPAARDRAVDATRKWSAHGWQPVGILALGSVVDDGAVEALEWRPGHGPDELAYPLARSPEDPASLLQMRALVYELAASARRDLPEPAWWKSLDRNIPPRVAVIGGGVAGLTAARELERGGASVTVYEARDEVGGKARSVVYDGRVFDLGAHLCSDAYRSLERLLNEIGCERESVSDVKLWELERGEVVPIDDTGVPEDWRRYNLGLRKRVPMITDPGLAHSEAELAEAASDLFEREGLDALARATAYGYTGSGYGYLDDPSIPALYVLKYAELGTFSMDPSSFDYWTPRGGFGAVWKAVADRLSDVRLGSQISRVIRTDYGVEVVNSGVSERFDALVVATPPGAIEEVLDLDDVERELTAATRTIDYVTVIARAKDLPRDGFYLVKENCETRSRAGRTVAFHHRYPDSDVYLFYAYLLPGTTDEDLRGRLDADARELGGKVSEVLEIHRWEYFPHVGPESLKSGVLSHAEANQGSSRTWWTGSLFGFELVEPTMQVATAVAAELMQTLEADAPSSSKDRAERVDPSAAIPVAPGDVRSLMVRVVGDELGMSPEEVPTDLEFSTMGLDSVKSVAILDELSRVLGRPMPPVLFFEYPTLDEVVAHLESEAAMSPRQAPAPVSPATAEGFDAYLRKTLARELGVPESSTVLDEDFSRMGLDSVRSVHLLDVMSRETGLVLAPVVFFEHSTIASLASELEEQSRAQGLSAAPLRPTFSTTSTAPIPAELDVRLQRIERSLAALESRSRPSPASTQRPRRRESAGSWSATHSPWLLRHAAAEPPRQRLVAFHGAGDSSQMCRDWPSQLPRDVELLAVELPGRGNHAEPALTEFEPIVDALTTALSAEESLSTVFFGHSFGALVAFEVARRLQAAGRPVARLIVASFWAPHRWTCHPALRRAVEARMDPLPIADATALDTWTWSENPVLECPISAIAASDDRVVPRDDVFAWSEIARGGAVVSVVPAGHLDVARNPRTVALIAAELLSLPAERVDHGREIRLNSEIVDALSLLDRQVTQRASTLGGWNALHTAHVVKVENDDGTPAYPGLLAETVRRLETDPDALVCSPFPSNEVVIGLALLGGLLHWSDRVDLDTEAARSLLCERILGAAARMREPLFVGTEHPYGREHRFPGQLGQRLLPAYQSRALLAEHRSALPADLVDSMAEWSTVEGFDDVEGLFERGDWRLAFAPYFGADVLRGEAAARRAEADAPDFVGHNASLAAEYFNATRHAPTKTLLDAAVASGEGAFRINGRLQDVFFTALFLAKGGVDLPRRCPQIWDYLARVQTRHGVGLDEFSRAIDVDSTAIALFVDHLYGRTSTVEQGERRLESRWSSKIGAYKNSLGDWYNTTILCTVLRTQILLNPVAAQRRRLWDRLLDNLEQRVWMMPDHLSPIYGWEAIVSTVCELEDRFPERRTVVHHRALERILSCQQDSGGFCSIYLEEPCEEETALAVMALKYAAAANLPPALAGKVPRALENGQKWLVDAFVSRRRARVRHPELWVGPVTFYAPNIIDGMTIGALHREPRPALMTGQTSTR